jgi:hypothetical protein
MSDESITDCRECRSWLLDARGYKGNTGESGICLISGMSHSCYPLTPCEAGIRKVRP